MLRMWLTNLLLFVLLMALTIGHAHGQSAYNVDRDQKLFTAQGQTYTIVNRIGALNLTFEYVVSGSPGSLTMTITGCMRGGTCDTLDTYVGTSNSNRKVTGLYDNYVITPTTLSGGTTPTVQMNVFFTAASSPAGAQGTLASQVQGTAASGSAVVGNPVLVAGKDGSGNAQTMAMNTSGGVVTAINVGAGVDGFSNAALGQMVTSVGQVPLEVMPFAFNGASWDRQGACPNTTLVSVAATTTQIIALSGTTKVRICGFILSGNATAGAVEIVYGTGSNCGTGTVSFGIYNVLGATAPPIVYNGGPLAPLTTIAAQAVCVRATTTTVTGTLIWGQW